jgi:hypothetical protein
MYIFEILKTLIIFLFIYFGILNLGYIANKSTFKKENNTGLNIVLGFLILSLFSGFSLVFKIFSINKIFIIIILSYLFLFLDKKIFKTIFCFKTKIIFFFLFIISVSSIQNNLYFNDDLHGYFKTINDFIYQTNIYSNELQYRLYYSYPFFLILNSIFISFSDFYSAWFLDLFFGSSLILSILKRNYKLKNKLIFLILSITILMTVLTIQDTNTPKLISIGLILFILFELEKFYNNNKYLVSVLITSSLLIIFKFINIASFTNIMILLILVEKTIKNKIKINELFLPIIVSLLIFLPWTIYSFQIFNSPLTLLMPSEFYYTENNFFKNLQLKYTHGANFFEYIYSRQILLTGFLSIIYFCLNKEKKFFKLSLITSFSICLIFFLITMFSDKSNFLRYMNQFFVSYSAFLIFKIIEEIVKKKINFKSYVVIIFLCLITIRVNQNLTIFIETSFNNIRYLVTKNYDLYYKKANKYFLIEQLYPDKYIVDITKVDSVMNNLSGRTLMIISKPYLFNFKKYEKSIDYIEYQFGYSLTKKPYPIFETTDKKIEFLKKREIKYFLVERKYLNHEDGLIKIFIDKNENLILDDFGIEKGSHELTAFYDDLMDLLLNKLNKRVFAENETFIIFEIKI